MTEQPAAQLFREAVSKSEQDLDLARSALLIAACRQPGLDVAHYLQRLDALANAVRTGLSCSTSSPDLMRAICHHLGTTEGFRGDTERYSDPKNSYLNEVLDRKIGIPITLSVIYIEVAGRLGIDARGVAFPGHFLVRFGEDNGVTVVDPFFAGISLGEEALMDRMRRFISDETAARVFLMRVLSGAPKSEIIARMLRNLVEVHRAAGEIELALTAADQVISATPRDPAAYRCRGELYEAIGVNHAAARDLEQCLMLNPDAADEREVRVRIAGLLKTASPLS